ncbi:MAG: endonuclease Q family protein [bacterium]
MFKKLIADLHIHIGRTNQGRAVKITASPDLTLAGIVRESLTRKGIDIAGIADCGSPGVLRDVDELMAAGELTELSEGGMLHRQRLTVILGSEVETVEEEGGVAHHLAYFPFLKQMKEFSRVMSRYISNIELSSQRATLTSAQLQAVIRAIGGVLVPAHAFTPHKSVYGNAARRLRDLFPVEDASLIPALELGLSADTDIADRLEELEQVSFLSSSDAHSLPKIGREYTVFEMDNSTFKELMLALNRENGRRISANYGLDPRLGRYHRSSCSICGKVAESPPPVLSCEFCGRSGDSFTRGVLDRVVEIQDYEEPRHPSHRPPYCYQVPLEFIPGVNKRVLDHLISYFGSEMAVLHSASSDDLKKAVGWEIANHIMLGREGLLKLRSGGGGNYGRVVRARTNEGEQMSLF